MAAVNVKLDMYLPPGTLCKAYDYQKTAAAAADQLGSLATDGRIVQSATAICGDVPVAVTGGRRRLHALTQPKITLKIVEYLPFNAAGSRGSVAHRAQHAHAAGNAARRHHQRLPSPRRSSSPPLEPPRQPQTTPWPTPSSLSCRRALPL
jgi:hypothetical protein